MELCVCQDRRQTNTRKQLQGKEPDTRFFLVNAGHSRTRPQGQLLMSAACSPRNRKALMAACFSARSILRMQGRGVGSCSCSLRHGCEPLHLVFTGETHTHARTHT